MTFVKDLRRGNVAEQLVCDLLEKSGFPTVVEKKLETHDLLSKYGETQFTTEVKFDEKEKETGNLAIEVFNSRANKPSGITVTRANFWCVVLADGFIWITSVKTLREHIDHNKPLKVIQHAGDGSATIYLYNSPDMLSEIFHRIDNCSISRIQKFIIRHMR
jgi:hypothetical protein